MYIPKILKYVKFNIGSTFPLILLLRISLNVLKTSTYLHDCFELVHQTEPLQRVG